MTATLGLSSCESFLSENPKDQITEEQAYQNSTLLFEPSAGFKFDKSIVAPPCLI